MISQKNGIKRIVCETKITSKEDLSYIDTLIGVSSLSQFFI
jgi:hypothetical protein